MAERRMISKSIISSDAFAELPFSAQALYFHLAIRSADDDGFINNTKQIQRMIGATDDDLNVLLSKGFILSFPSGVFVIKHWKIHNHVRVDRYNPTVYQDELNLLRIKENGEYTYDLKTDCQPNDNQVATTCQPNDNQVATQDRTGQDSTVKLSKGEGSMRGEKSNPTDYKQIADLYNSICKSFPTLYAISDARKKSIKARLNSGYSVDDFKRLFVSAEKSSFLKGKNDRNWQATFDWLIKDTNMAKVLDGNYSDSKTPKGNTPVRHGGTYV